MIFKVPVHTLIFLCHIILSITFFVYFLFIFPYVCPHLLHSCILLSSVLVCNWFSAVVEHFSILIELNYIIIIIIITIIISANSGSSNINKSVYFLC
jgi:hypothetical protein